MDKGSPFCRIELPQHIHRKEGFHMNDFTTAYSKFKGGGKTAMLSNAYYQNLYDIANHSLYLFQDYVRNFTNRTKK